MMMSAPDYGHAIAWWNAGVMIANIASYIADNQIERDVNDVERFITEAGGDGRDTRSVMFRQTYRHAVMFAGT